MGILRYEGSKSGIFEVFPETQGTKVCVATGQVRFHFPIPVLTTFLVIFGFAATMLTPDFDSKYLKVQIPHFSEIFRLKQKFWMGGGQGTPPLFLKLYHMSPG